MHEFPKKYFFSEHPSSSPLIQEETNGEKLSLLMPPMKVAGDMQLSDAYTLILEDILHRSNALVGKDTLWVPYIDHSGIILSENREKSMRDGGITKELLQDSASGWKEQYRSHVREIYMRYGITPNWEKEIFSLDDHVMKKGEEVFIDLYEKGLIYHEESIASYSPRLGSIIAEHEVEEREIEVKLFHITYFISGSDKEVVIMTTRPETLFADEALAVHPKDKRYKKILGKKALIPILNREIPIITDPRVDMNFRGGIMRVTPAHDRWSYTIAKDHHLNTNTMVIDREGKMKKEAGIFAGQIASSEARANIVELIRAKGNLVSQELCREKVGFCMHSDARVEDIICHQWFLRTKVLIEKVIAGYKNDEFTILPEKYAKSFEEHLFSLNDQCISRQFWWGQKIPAYNNNKSGEWTVSSTRSDGAFVQEGDVLDPHFTSSLVPLIALGWEKGKSSPLFESYYPFRSIEAGNNILAETIIMMLMMGYEYTGKSPFSTIHLHGNVTISERKIPTEGKKHILFQSERRENNPTKDLLNTYGSDAMRLALILRNPLGNNFHLDTHVLEEYALFLTKLWNMTRFIWLQTGMIEKSYEEIVITLENHKKSLLPYESWILSRISYLEERKYATFRNYEFGIFGNELFHSVTDEFANFALEAYKIEKEKSIYGKDVLSYSVMKILFFFYPFIPNITTALSEALFKRGYHSLLESGKSTSTWKRDKNKEKALDLISTLISSIRSMRSRSNIAPQDTVSVILVLETPDIIPIEENIHLILSLTKSTTVDLSHKAPEKYNTYESLGGVGIYMNYAIDTSLVQTELKRLETQIEEKRIYIRTLSEKLSNNTFLQNAPERIIRAEMEKRNLALEQVEKFEKKMQEFKGKDT